MKDVDAVGADEVVADATIAVAVTDVAVAGDDVELRLVVDGVFLAVGDNNVN